MAEENRTSPITENQQREDETKLAPIFTAQGSNGKASVKRTKTNTPKRKRTDSDRTPSGQELTGKVDNLKNLFGARAFGESFDRFNFGSLKNLKGLRTNPGQDPTQKCNQPVLSMISDNNKHAMVQHDQRSATNDSSKAGCHNTGSKETDSTSSPMHGAEKLVEECGKPREVMDVRIVLSMFQELKSEIAEIKMDMASLSATGKVSDEGRNKIADIERAIESHDEGMTICENKMKNISFNEQVLIGAIQRLNKRLEDTQEKVLKLENNNAKRMAVLSGLYVDEDKKIARLQLDSFIKEELEVEVQIDDFYYIGAELPKNIVLTFQSLEDKRILFRRIQQTKQYVNKDDRKIVLRDFYTPEQQENRRRQATIRKINNAREEDFKRGNHF